MAGASGSSFRAWRARLRRTLRRAASGSTTFFPPPRFARRRFSNFVFWNGQHRTAFDFSYLSEVLREAGFREVERSTEGKSRLYGTSVPPYEPGESKDLPHSLFVEAFK